MYHYLYKITNLINDHFYYGVHNTENLEDGYMGSGFRLKKAYIKYGINNFKKEIIQFFDTMEEAFEKEHEVVNEELIKLPECYNMQIGGRYFNTVGKVAVKDRNGNKFWLFKTDEIYQSGELIPIWTGKHHKKESRNKTRDKMTPVDSSNPRIWICKEGKVKYLRKELLEEYINNGWELGRVGYKPRTNKQGVKIE